MSASTVKVSNVVIVGGTHGNETNGVLLSRYWRKNSQEVQRPSFSTLVVTANEEAAKASVRYVETDLNRCFDLNVLSDESLKLKEHNRARDLNRLIGPKGSEEAASFVIDMHNTTANTGVLPLMRKNDALGHAVANHLQDFDDTLRVVEWSFEDPPYLGSLGKSGMTFEVGPVPQGCAHGELLQKTRKLILLTLDFLHSLNVGDVKLESFSMNVFENAGKVDFPRDADGVLTATIHPRLQGKDFLLLNAGDPIFLTFDGKDIVHQGSACYPFFINEAAYYEKNVAFCCGNKQERSFPSGDF